jgi:outer membrane receptor for ferrienterochelin and colicins
MEVDNLFNYVPKYFYSNSPTTNGMTFALGVSLDIDRWFDQ